MDYDLFVIGTGTAGTSAASICSTGGMSVAIADYRKFGGTCALRGCAPKKVLVGSSTLYYHLTKMANKGIFDPHTSLYWKQLMDFKRTFTEPFPTLRRKLYRKKGIDAYKGKVSFIDENTVTVGNKTITSEKFLIASGSMPRRLNIPGEDMMCSSEDFLELDTLPERIVFVGGGYISFEFAHLAALAGADVTILHRGPKPLSNFEESIVHHLLSISRDMGVKVLLNSSVVSIEKDGDTFLVNTDSKGTASVYRSDCVVHGAGRTPEIDELGLDGVGVKHSKNGVIVNRYMQSVSNPSFYAAGDVVEGTPMLKNVSEMEGIIAGKNILNGNRLEIDYTVIPSVLFTVPEIASVGRCECDLDGSGMDYDVIETDMSQWFSSRYLGSERAYAKVMVEKEGGKILGAHLINPRAGELINLFTLAIKCKINIDTLKTIPWAFPTNTSDISYII